MRLFALAVALAATTTLSAATGPEIAVSAPAAAEAPFSQYEPNVASNGSDYFAIWLDSRSSSETSSTVSLYGSRVTADGHFVQPFGVRFADDVYRAAITSSGRGYLLAYSQFGGPTFAYRISDDGTVLQPSITISNEHFLYALASNGNGYVALMSDAGAMNFWAIFLDASGVPRTPMIDLGRLWGPSLLAAGSDYRIVDLQYGCDGQTPCNVIVRLTSLNNATHAVTQTVVGPPVTAWTRVSAIATDRIYIALVSDGSPESGQAGRTITMETTDFAGNVLAQPRIIGRAPTTCYCGWARASLAVNGNEVLVGWPRLRTGNSTESDSKVVAVRVRPDLTVIDDQPFDVTSAIATEFVAATSANGVLLLSSEQRRFIRPYYYGAPDLFTHSIRSFAELTGPHAEDAIVEAAPAEFESAVATIGIRAFVAWREFDQPSAIRASVIQAAQPTVSTTVTLADRAQVSRSGVSIAALREAALVVWREETEQGLRILAKRIGSDGAVLDDNAIVVADQRTEFPPPGITSVATDGRQFFVVWNNDQEVFGVRLLADGTVVDHEPILISRETTEGYHLRINPRVVWTGTLFLVSWSDDPRFPSLVSPPLPPRSIVRQARVTPAGALIDASESRTLIDSTGGIANVALAVNDDTVMTVFSSTDPGTQMRCSLAFPMDRDGQPTISDPRLIDCDPFNNSNDTPLDVTVSAAGDRFAVYWASSANDDVRGRSLSKTGVAGAVFAVSPAGFAAWRPAAAPMLSGTFVTYTRIAPEPQYGRVPRVFGRVVDAVASPKQRAVKH